MSMNGDFLTLRAATVKLGKRQFGEFNLSLAHGERVAILGPSGAGKSTLLKMMAGELPVSGGEIAFGQGLLADWSKSELSARRAVLPQSHEVAFGLPAELVIGLGRVARAHDPKLSDIVYSAAEYACADHLIGRRFDTLSGGEKARVQLARVFAQIWDTQNALLFVDEPLSALDPGLQFQLMDTIDSFAAERHHAVVAVLHDINHALSRFDRLLLVKDGAPVADIAADLNAVVYLEELYGIRIATARTADGEVLVVPSKR